MTGAPILNPSESAAQASASTVESAPRAIVESAADAIEVGYFDRAAGTELASALRAEAADGLYDHLAPIDLAARLTSRLSPLDRHFRLSYSPDPACPADNAPASGYGPEEEDRRSGYGFRRIEVMPGNVGYIELLSFVPIDFSDPDWRAWRAVDAALSLVSSTDALLIDLRQNGGGHPSMVGYLISAFVPAKAEVYNEFRAGDLRQSERPPIAYPSRLEMPVYILISGRTGSGAESFAYTMQAAARATIVGEISSGAANPGGYVHLTDHFALFVPSATPINPVTGRNWEGVGVLPDIEVTADEALDRARLLALENALGRIPPAERLHAQWALELLEAEKRRQVAGSLEPFAGTFGEIEIRIEGDRLLYRCGMQPRRMLVRIEGDLFASPESASVRYAFERGPNGHVKGIETRRLDGSRSFAAKTT